MQRIRPRSGAGVRARASLPRRFAFGGQDLVHPIPGRAVDDRLVLARVALALVHGLAEVGAVAQDLVQRALVERPALAEGAGLRGPGLGAVALSVQLSDQQEGRAEVEEAAEDQADQLGLGRVHHQLAVPDVIAERRVAAHEDALAAAGGELVPDPFARELALELRERQQDVQRQPAHRSRGAERLRHRDEGDAVPLEHVDQLGKVGERAGQPIDLVADDGVDPAGLDVADQPLQRRALQRAAAVPAVVVAVVEREPAFMALAVDVGCAGLALGVEAVEGQLETLLAGLPACRSRSGPCA